MNRLSVRTLAAGFTVAAILLCLTVAFVIALAFPAPPPARVTLAEAQAALNGEAETGWRCCWTRRWPRYGCDR